MFTTTFEGESLLHRELWRVVEQQCTFSAEQNSGTFYTNVAAMVFAFHTVEAYLNFVGEKLDPSTWRIEREYFRNEPYRGFAGKLRKVMEMVGLSLPESNRPLRTIYELKNLRDLIAHAKPEKLIGEVSQTDDLALPLVTATLQQLVTESARLLAVTDVEQFLNAIHVRAKPKIADVWFGDEALRGTAYHMLHSTKLQKE